MKTIHYKSLSSVLLLAATVACTPDMDIKNPSEIPTSDYYTNTTQLEKAVNSAYEALVGQYLAYNSGGVGRYLYYNLLLPGDDYDNTYKWPGMYQNTYNVPANSNDTQTTWRSFFTGVRAANIAVHRIEAYQPSGDEAERDRLLGESYFLRGFFNLMLCSMYGETIPLYTSVISSNNDYYPANAKPGEVYAAIVADFLKAATLLPERSKMYANSALIGRATKGAAEAYLARTYLWRPILERGQKPEYAKAAEVLKGIIDSGEYSLMPSFRDNFQNTSTSENCAESVFEVQLENDANASWSFSWRWKEVGLPDGTGGAWWNCAPNQVAYHEFEEGDPRRYMTLWCPDGAYFNDTEKGKKLNWNDMVNALSSDKDMFGTRKECIEETFNDLMDDYNDRLMRYADVLLMYAESLYFTGHPGTDRTDRSGAKYWIQQVRDRANNIVPNEQPHLWYQHAPGRLPNVDDLLSSGLVINGRPMSDMANLIVHERAVEFMGEYLRYFDLMRFGLAVDAHFLEPLKAKGWTEAKMYYPFPQSELNNDKNLKGNEAN